MKKKKNINESAIFAVFESRLNFDKRLGVFHRACSGARICSGLFNNADDDTHMRFAALKGAVRKGEIIIGQQIGRDSPH